MGVIISGIGFIAVLIFITYIIKLIIKKRGNESSVITTLMRPNSIIAPGTNGVKYYRGWDLGPVYSSYHTNFTARFECIEDYGDSVLVKIIDISGEGGYWSREIRYNKKVWY